jgi:hypothetical protein
MLKEMQTPPESPSKQITRVEKPWELQKQILWILHD